MWSIILSKQNCWSAALKFPNTSITTCHLNSVCDWWVNLHEASAPSRIYHFWYIKDNEPRTSYALHILNCRHEYGNINNIMTFLKQVNKPSLLLPYEQMFIQPLHHSNELITEQHPNEYNAMFEFLLRETRYVTNQ